jgi:hypothetical protein
VCLVYNVSFFELFGKISSASPTQSDFQTSAASMSFV